MWQLTSNLLKSFSARARTILKFSLSLTVFLVVRGRAVDWLLDRVGSKRKGRGGGGEEEAKKKKKKIDYGKEKRVVVVCT